MTARTRIALAITSFSLFAITALFAVQIVNIVTLDNPQFSYFNIIPAQDLQDPGWSIIRFGVGIISMLLFAIDFSRAAIGNRTLWSAPVWRIIGKVFSDDRRVSAILFLSILTSIPTNTFAAPTMIIGDVDQPCPQLSEQDQQIRTDFYKILDGNEFMHTEGSRCRISFMTSPNPNVLIAIGWETDNLWLTGMFQKSCEGNIYSGGVFPIDNVYVTHYGPCNSIASCQCPANVVHTQWALIGECLNELGLGGALMTDLEFTQALNDIRKFTPCTSHNHQQNWGK